MTLQIPKQPYNIELPSNSSGIHSSRTMMLLELRLLLSACSADTRLEDYQSAIVDENVLLKRTVATRKVSFNRLKEL